MAIDAHDIRDPEKMPSGKEGDDPLSQNAAEIVERLCRERRGARCEEDSRGRVPPHMLSGAGAHEEDPWDHWTPIKEFY